MLTWASLINPFILSIIPCFYDSIASWLLGHANQKITQSLSPKSDSSTNQTAHQPPLSENAQLLSALSSGLGGSQLLLNDYIYQYLWEPTCLRFSGWELAVVTAKILSIRRHDRQHRSAHQRHCDFDLVYNLLCMACNTALSQYACPGVLKEFL